jgi:predicted AAA+ superfamily ATPase
MIERSVLKEAVFSTIRTNPIAAILGPRQCGKTTLARMIAATRDDCEVFDLENPVDISRLSAPMQALAPLNGLVIIDEIQRKPELFELLRVLVDRPESNALFLVLGSASPQLVKATSESLAGRVGFVDMSGFSLDEIGHQCKQELWTRGGFPRSFLASDDDTSYTWRRDFIRTFLERDIPQYGITIPAETLRRFWTMLAHYHGQTWNCAEFARALGSSEPTARRYLDILCGAYMVRALPPWHENIKKRQVKSPKVYIRDSGLLHALLSIETHRDLQTHPKLGASWEGFVLEQVLSAARTRDAYFWATHGGAELDLLLFKHGRRYGIEIKYADAPTVTKSLRIAMQDLRLHKATIIYPGGRAYPLDEKIGVLPVSQIETAFDDKLG